MTDLRRPNPVLLVVAVFSRHIHALAWARSQLEQAFGPIALTSPTYHFNQTKYYEPSMGPALQKHFLAFNNLVEADYLADVKQHTNKLEEELIRAGMFPEPR